MKLFVPGRICLLGEHSDWAGGYRRINADIEKGYTIICGTNQGIYADVEPHPHSLILSSIMPDGQVIGPVEIPMEPQTLLNVAREGGFWSYIAGVAYQVLIHYHVRGLVIHNYKTDLPIKKGLASSAAICVLTARAFNRIYDLKLTVRGEMELAYQGEITTPSRCGRMDQGCAFGSRPILMIFDGDRLDIKEINIPKEIYFAVVDLRSKKDTLEILNRLNRCYPVAENDLEHNVQKLLGQINKYIVNQSIIALQNSDPKQLGELMIEAQINFDRFATPACPEELTAPILHKILEYPKLKPYTYGGKGVGSQGDGTAQFLAKSESDQETIVQIIENDLHLSCYKLTLQANPKVRKALIPAAGFGTRLFPASKAIKKELFPIIDRDGIAKPVILLVVEEALQAGIEEIIIVIQKDDLNDFRSFFNTQISIENYNRLPINFQEYSSRILEIGQRITFIIQQAQEGFGNTVYCAREAIGDEPFLLMPGDHLYRSNSTVSCAQQLVDAYQEHGTSIVGMCITPENRIANFCVATGVWAEENRLLNITEFAEKPTLEYARTNLHMPDLDLDQYLTIFGRYILKPEIFDFLEVQIKNNLREHGEFQLTSALDRLRQTDGFLGLIMDGRRYDIGLPDYYLDTLINYRHD